MINQIRVDLMIGGFIFPLQKVVDFKMTKKDSCRIFKKRHFMTKVKIFPIINH